MMKTTTGATRVVEAARGWLGTPYLHQATLKHVGCDCLGLVRGVWREVEGAEPEIVPAYSSTWSETGSGEELLAAGLRNFSHVPRPQRQPGDLLVFRLRPRSAAKHVGILATLTSFIHAYEGTCVVENTLSDFWENRIAAVFRFPSAAREPMGSDQTGSSKDTSWQH